MVWGRLVEFSHGMRTRINNPRIDFPKLSWAFAFQSCGMKWSKVASVASRPSPVGCSDHAQWLGMWAPSLLSTSCSTSQHECRPNPWHVAAAPLAHMRGASPATALGRPRVANHKCYLATCLSLFLQSLLSNALIGTCLIWWRGSSHASPTILTSPPSYIQIPQSVWPVAGSKTIALCSLIPECP